MSISRKNWSALSSLARQWTMEDEEEVERERRRRVKSSSSFAEDPDAPETSTSIHTSGSESTTEPSSGLSSAEQLQLDFVEMLRVRDEKRRMRHVETLRRQKEEGEDEAEASRGGGEGGARVELLGDLDEEQGCVLPSVKTTSTPQPPQNTISYSPRSHSSSIITDFTNRHEHSESPSKEPDPKPPSTRARKFVSSVSISLDKSHSVSGRTTPMSPQSPNAPLSPGEHWSPCPSPSPRGPQSPVHNGHAQETSKDDSSSNGNFEQTTKPAFVRQSSRTVSVRMMRKKEGTAPLQRSASMRMASKKFEPNTDQDPNEEDKPSTFQRNSRQRYSSRAIQEKMERLAQAAQKSEVTRSPDVTQRTLFLLDEVSRKRGLFEKDKKESTQTSLGVSRQEFRSFASGMSDRINRWLNKTNQTGPGQSSSDLRNVDISSKRSLFENRGEDSESKASPVKLK